MKTRVLVLAAILGTSSCLAAILGTSSCRSCAEASDARPSIDVSRGLARARVPAIAWASFTAETHSSGAVGYSDVEAKTVASDTTPFEAASIAKMVIAVAVLQLVEEGLVSLDADVATYVGFPIRSSSATPITLRHLLTHTSSILDLPETTTGGQVALGDFLHGYFSDGGARSIFLDAGPGAVASYSNVGPSLAALAVERVTKTQFADRAFKRIFEPLGMTTAFFATDGRPPPRLPAVPYAAEGSSFVRLKPPSHALYPVVDFFASARDLVRFGQALLRDGDRVLRPESVAEMLRVPFDAAPDDALGFQVRTFGGRRVIGHEGEDIGASTGLYIDREAKVGALILTNGDAFHSEDAERAKALAQLLEDLLRRR